MAAECFKMVFHYAGIRLCLNAESRNLHTCRIIPAVKSGTSAGWPQSAQAAWTPETNQSGALTESETWLQLLPL